MVFEVLFDFESGHAARARGGDGLTVAAVLYVACGEDAGDDLTVERGEDIVFALDVAVAIQIHLAFEELGVRNVTDAEEEAAERDLLHLAGDGVAHADAADFLLFDSKNLFHDGVRKELNLRVGHGAFQHDLAGAEGARAMDQVNLGGKAREEDGFFHGGVAAADDADLFAGEEEAVAGGAGRNTVADEGLFAGQA